MAHTLYRHYKVLLAFLLLFDSISPLYGQKPQPYLASDNFDPEARGEHSLRVAFYNVENLFDYFDDSLKLDDEFLPYQGRFWTKEKYQRKVQGIAQTIIAIGGWEPPAIVGLCEVENRYVLQSLTKFSVMKSANYEVIHKDSPDVRGIDVALLYRKEKFDLIDYDFIEIQFPFDRSSKTRDILYAQGQLPNLDTLHLLVNHWPSKFGGEFETEPKRQFASQVVSDFVDSLLRSTPDAKIMIMGDFNDSPSSKSLLELTHNRPLTNLMTDLEYKYGTHSFENEWLLIDQMIVSNNLLQKNSNTKIQERIAIIFNQGYLLTEGALGNKRPIRTYQGPAYKGGFSDHLPIYLDLTLVH